MTDVVRYRNGKRVAIVSRAMIPPKPLIRDILRVATVPLGKVRMAEVISAVAESFELPVSEIKGLRRFGSIMEARLCFYTLAYELTGQSRAAIGRFCGGRDHSTVISGLKSVQKNPTRWALKLDACRKRAESAELSKNVENSYIGTSKIPFTDERGKMAA